MDELVEYGMLRLSCRGYVLEDEADERGYLDYRCWCGYRISGFLEDDGFLHVLHGHVGGCLKLPEGAMFPVELGVEGVCPECAGHDDMSGERCRNKFVNKDGNVVDRCKCFSIHHVRKSKGWDTSMRSR